MAKMPPSRSRHDGRSSHRGCYAPAGSRLFLSVVAAVSQQREQQQSYRSTSLLIHVGLWAKPASLSCLAFLDSKIGMKTCQAEEGRCEV